MNPGSRTADFILTLHSHLPFVLHHGRWPHGSDWLCEAALDTYLPLVERLRALERGGVAAPLTLGVTPVLAAQLAHLDFATELDDYLLQRLASCDAAERAMHGTADASLLPLVAWWRERLRRLCALWASIGRDLCGEFRRLHEAGRLELVTSAATHAFLPLLGRDESIRLQLAVGRAEHARRFGHSAAGCWLPECGYRPRGMWSPTPDAPGRGVRRGIDEHLAEAGFGWCWVDAHVAHAGSALGAYTQRSAATPGRGVAPRLAAPGARAPATPTAGETYSPYRAYRVQSGRAGAIAVLVRDPRASMRVWSRGSGYPGDSAYLEFHKIRWPEGLRLWRVTDRESDLAEKQPYEPGTARLRAHHHAEDYAALLDDIAASRAAGTAGVIVTPFDTELFGHWWSEGIDFLGDLFESLGRHPRVHPSTAGAHLERHPPRTGIRLARGSWGKDGDYSMWLNDDVEWLWPMLWKLEEDFWRLAAQALARPDLHPILEQAARELLLAQSSDWPFIMTTGEVADYGRRRFEGHAADARLLLGALAEALAGEPPGRAVALAASLGERDALFTDLVPCIAEALGHAPVRPAGRTHDRRR